MLQFIYRFTTGKTINELVAASRIRSITMNVSCTFLCQASCGNEAVMNLTDKVP